MAYTHGASCISIPRGMPLPIPTGGAQPTSLPPRPGPPHPLRTYTPHPSTSRGNSLHFTLQAQGEAEERRRRSEDDVELRLRGRRRRQGTRNNHHSFLVVVFLLVLVLLLAAAPPAPVPPAPPQERRRRGRGRGGGGGGRVARGAVGGGVAAAPEAGRALRGDGGVGAGVWRRRGLPWGRRRRRGGGARAEPHRRRPGGAEGVRGSGLRLQLRRDPRALRHPPRPRALLLHEPALPRRPPPPPLAAPDASGGVRAAAPLAADCQLEDLQPRGQPGRGEGAAQVLGAGGGVHRQALQLNGRIHFRSHHGIGMEPRTQLVLLLLLPPPHRLRWLLDQTRTTKPCRQKASSHRRRDHGPSASMAALRDLEGALGAYSWRMGVGSCHGSVGNNCAGAAAVLTAASCSLPSPATDVNRK